MTGPVRHGVGSVAGVARPTARARALRRAATPAERRLWQALSGSRLGWKFSRQMPVGAYVCDFLCRSARLAVEVDGFSHDVSVAEDARRDAFLTARGIRVLRFSNAEVLGDLGGVTEAIRLALSQNPPPAPPASGRGENALLPPSRLREGSGVGLTPHDATGNQAR